MIQTDRPDKKTPDILTTLVPPLEKGAVGTVPNEDQTKSNTIPEEEEKLMEWELRMHIEEEKYKIYVGQLSPEKSNSDIDTDKSDYPFLD